MKKFLIKILIECIIAFVIVSITKAISNTYLCGGIAGILTIYSTVLVDEFYKRLEESE